MKVDANIKLRVDTVEEDSALLRVIDDVSTRPKVM